ncbi:MAG TPA: isoaspartyl peptidase/L-asparaginase [Gemmatimonadota bacterium]|nr:isoaspartyl peptidase/L-asparaginase [Gemmatimonadota bacterium]
MRRIAATQGLAVAGLLLLAPGPDVRGQTPEIRPTIVVHGGAGSFTRANTDSEAAGEIHASVGRALEAGMTVLDAGGSSLDAVEAAIRMLEDDPRFNAGKGAVFAHEARNELDASIMDGATRRAGAVAGVTHVKNPISLARLVMEETRHVLLAREGAEEFAIEQGVELVSPDYFFTPGAWEGLMRARENERAAAEATSTAPSTDEHYGTVGVLALDREGRLAAGTSTGGLTNKRWGRIGDSPLIGAGTWADERCAVSATGTGEFFIRNAVAYDICARVRYLDVSLAEAAETVIMDVLVEQGGDGGVIALDSRGNVSMPFNTGGMARGVLRSGGEPETWIFVDR